MGVYSYGYYLITLLGAIVNSPPLYCLKTSWSIFKKSNNKL